MDINHYEALTVILGVILGEGLRRVQYPIPGGSDQHVCTSERENGKEEARRAGKLPDLAWTNQKIASAENAACSLTHPLCKVQSRLTLVGAC